jgi:hypothetical protein
LHQVESSSPSGRACACCQAKPALPISDAGHETYEAKHLVVMQRKAYCCQTQTSCSSKDPI